MQKGIKAQFERIDCEEFTKIIEDSISGDEKAFERLMEVCSGYIISYISKFLRTKEEIEDVSQDVLLRVYKSIKNLSSPYAFTAWLKKIMTYTCDSYNRKNSKYTNTLELDKYAEKIATQNCDDMPYRSYEKKEEQIYINQCINMLPGLQKQVLYMYCYEKISYRQISERLGIAVPTVGSALSKARNNMKKMMFGKEKTFLGSIVALGFNPQGYNAMLTEVQKSFVASLKSTDFSSIPANIGKISHIAQKAAALAASAVLATCLGIVLVSHDEKVISEPKLSAADIQSELPTEITRNVNYKAHNAEISFGGNDTEPGENVNPKTASISVNDEEGIINTWEITSEDGKTIASGTSETAQIPSLAPGGYKISWEVASENIAISQISRGFFME